MRTSPRPKKISAPDLVWLTERVWVVDFLLLGARLGAASFGQDHLENAKAYGTGAIETGLLKAVEIRLQERVQGVPRDQYNPLAGLCASVRGGTAKQVRQRRAVERARLRRDGSIQAEVLAEYAAECRRAGVAIGAPLPARRSA
jgi:hypothetical protein